MKVKIHDTHRLGWVPDFPDVRDLFYQRTMGVQYPVSIDLRSKFPVPSYDQGQLGSCTANAIAGAIQYVEHQETGSDAPDASDTPSRLFIYYEERAIEHTVSSDSGAMIRDGFKVLNKYGYISEATWPYDISTFSRKPTSAFTKEAKKYKTAGYLRLNVLPGDMSAMKDCLVAGFPFVFGFTVYSSFENVGSDGVMPMPNFSSESVLGGHAVLAMGYDENRRVVIVRNSWSDGWGDKGYFYMPYDYITNPQLCDDFWTLRTEK